MSPHQTIAVGVRLFTVWLAIYVASASLSFYSQLRGGNVPSGSWVLLVALVVACVAIFALWVFPMTIARKLLASPAAPPADATSPDGWLGVGCALIGLWALSSALPALVMDGAGLYLFGSKYLFDAGVGMARILSHIVQLMFAAWLILGAAGFRRVFWWARNAGINRAL